MTPPFSIFSHQTPESCTDPCFSCLPSPPSLLFLHSLPTPPQPPQNFLPYLMSLANSISLLLPQKTPERRKRSYYSSIPTSVRLNGVFPWTIPCPTITLCISVPSSCHRLRPRETLDPPPPLSPRLATGNGWEGVTPRYWASDYPPGPVSCQDAHVQNDPLAPARKALEQPRYWQNSQDIPKFSRNPTPAPKP